MAARHFILVTVFALLSLTFGDKPAVQAQAAPTCQAVSIRCPVAGGCTVGDPFGPRVHPVTGVRGQQHWGTDYRASAGTGVLSAAAGTIERSYLSESYGNTIVVRHQDGGATLYAHLRTRAVTVGATVSAGQLLGEANNTGTQTTGDHLHFEYVPNGQIIQSSNRIDPDACVGLTVSGSIRVADNGALADDAFRVAIDGFIIGETSIGAANNLAANNLIPGSHTLTITAVVAPDNVGTYSITLSNGWTFQGGSTFESNTLPQGSSRSYFIIVPNA